MSEIILLVAVANNNVMGYQGSIPWHCSEDIKRFKRITTGYPVVMGRKTWESLPMRPLPMRPNIVLSRDETLSYDSAAVFTDIDQVIYNYTMYDKIFIIGGEEIFRACMDIADTIDICVINRSIKGDTFFPEIDDVWDLYSFEQSGDLCFRIYHKSLDT
ncbi:MAG: dihydrofolate reductase [Candidatus Peribacteraceae bacterium]|nr:dihydrofolate reductase [Candidatus Peribacteraceae bacterium]